MTYRDPSGSCREIQRTHIRTCHFTGCRVCLKERGLSVPDEKKWDAIDFLFAEFLDQDLYSSTDNAPDTQKVDRILGLVAWMSEGQLPSNVHVLTPRTMSLSDRLDRFLEEHALAPSEKPVRRDPTRPNAPGINAIECASCGQMEYLSRDHCRCGHYIRGQLEDEFLTWAREIAEQHQRLAETVALKVRKLRYLNLLGLPFVVIPLLFLTFSSEEFFLAPFVWIAVGVAVMGVCASVERHLQKPVKASQNFLCTYTLETFLYQRPFLQ